jgi:large repetitive protein
LFIITVTAVNDPPVVTAATLATASESSSYNASLEATDVDGTTSFNFALASGSLPSGLTLSAAGIISGTPTNLAAQGGVNGTYSFNVTANDGSSTSNAQTFSLTVSDPTVPTITTASLPNGTEGLVYSPPSGFQIVASDTDADPLRYTVSSGALPAGLNLNSSTGVISGTPGPQSAQNGSPAGTYDLNITISDGSSSSSKAFTILIADNSKPVVNNAALPGATEGVPYVASITATDADADTVTFVLTGSLPPNLSFNPVTGLITGTPTVQAAQGSSPAGQPVGTYQFSVTASDGRQVSNPQTHKIVVADPTVPTFTTPAPNLPDAIEGTPYNFSLAFSDADNDSPLTISFTGSLPPGLTLDAAGVISGTPNNSAPKGAPDTFNVKVSDGNVSSIVIYQIFTRPAAPVIVLLSNTSISGTKTPKIDIITVYNTSDCTGTPVGSVTLTGGGVQNGTAWGPIAINVISGSQVSVIGTRTNGVPPAPVDSPCSAPVTVP